MSLSVLFLKQTFKMGRVRETVFIYFYFKDSRFQKVKDYSLLVEAFWNLKDCSVIITHANDLDMKLTNTKLIITYTNCSPKNSNIF